MNCSAKPTSTPEILKWRDLYRQEMNCQIIHDSLHVRPGWTEPYFLFVDAVAVGYGAIAVGGPWAGASAIFEFYVQPAYRLQMFALFQALCDACGASKIETQSNAGLLTVMLHAFAQDVKTESILFRDEQTTSHSVVGAAVRRASPDDVETLRQLDLDAEATSVLTLDGAIVGAGGVLFHYNRPYGDIYMKVVSEHRRRGLGSYFVQEMKRICREEGNEPAARCNPLNVASRQTLQKAGFVPCGHILVGTLISPGSQQS